MFLFMIMSFTIDTILHGYETFQNRMDGCSLPEVNLVLYSSSAFHSLQISPIRVHAAKLELSFDI